MPPYVPQERSTRGAQFAGSVGGFGQNLDMAPDEGAEPDIPFLVAYDYGGGGLWAVIMVPSIVAIASKLTVLEEQPTWMTSDRYEELLGQPLRLDDPPSGVLQAVIADRQR